MLYVAIGADIVIAAAKFFVAALTGSSAMLTEGLHSLVDMGNELMLLHGVRLGRRTIAASQHGKVTTRRNSQSPFPRVQSRLPRWPPFREQWLRKAHESSKPEGDGACAVSSWSPCEDMKAMGAAPLDRRPPPEMH
jgi:hypothetical protein